MTGRIKINPAVHAKAFANELPSRKRYSETLDNMPCTFIKEEENGVVQVDFGYGKTFVILPSMGEEFVPDEAMASERKS